MAMVIHDVVNNVLTFSLLRIGKRFCPVLVLLTCAALVARAEEWEYIGLPGTNIEAIVVRSSDSIYAGTWAGPSSLGGVFRTTNAGVTWEKLLEANVYELRMHPTDMNTLYAGFGTVLAPYGIKKTTDGGVGWFDADSGIYADWETYVRDIQIDPLHPDTLYAGTGGFQGGNIYKSTDGGTSWMAVGTGNLLAGVISIAIHPETTSTLYAGTPWTGDLHKSTNGGISWALTGLQQYDLVTDVKIDSAESEVMYAAVATLDGGLRKSVNGGATWVLIGAGLPPQSNTSRLLVNSLNREVYARVGSTNPDSGGFFRSADMGTSWRRITGLAVGNGGQAVALSPDGHDLYVAIGNNGIYRTSIITGVHDDGGVFPAAISLFQNYPNPFNPATVIEFEIGHSVHVELRVFDILGNEVAKLVDEKKHSGRYRIQFDATDLASGVYVYRLETSPGPIIVKKMLLIR